MPKIIEVPGIGNVEFPDGVPDQEISRTIRLHTPEPDAKGSPEWASWRNQRVSDLNDAASSANKPEDKGFFHGLWQAVNPFPAIGDFFAGKDPATGKNAGPLQGAVNLAVNTGNAARDQANKAADAYKQGDYVSAGGHALAAALPIVGPAAANAGDAISDGRTGEGLGQAAGVIGSVLAPHAVSGAAKLLDTAAPAAGAAAEAALRASAEKGYARVLNPTTNANKLRTAEVVPGLIDRGVMARTQAGLQAKAIAEIGKFGQAIGDAWNNLPAGTTTELDPIFQKLQNEIVNTHSVADANGKAIPAGPEAERAIGNITKLQETLTDISQTDPQTGKQVIPVEKARFLRQYFDGVAESAGRSSGANLAADSTAQAHAIAADSIRNQLAQDHPDIAALNKEYSFWKDVNQVVTDTIKRKQGQAPSLGSQIAGAAGYAKGGALGAGAMKTLTAATASPGWRTVSAVLKDRLADAIAKGQPGPAEFYANKISTAVLAGSQGTIAAGEGIAQK